MLKPFQDDLYFQVYQFYNASTCLMMSIKITFFFSSQTKISRKFVYILADLTNFFSRFIEIFQVSFLLAKVCLHSDFWQISLQFDEFFDQKFKFQPFQIHFGIFQVSFLLAKDMTIFFFSRFIGIFSSFIFIGNKTKSFLDFRSKKLLLRIFEPFLMKAKW